MLVRKHLATELEVDPAKIAEGTRFREDLDADSLDLYELVMELEDEYGIGSPRKRRPRSRRSATRSSSSSPESRLDRGRWPSGGHRFARRAARIPARGALGAGADALLLDRASSGLLRPPGLPRRQRARPGDRRRAALALPDADSGELTKVHNQVVSGRAIAEVARQLGIPELISARAPSDGSGLPASTLTSTERPLAEVTEALIGACFLENGFEEVAGAVVAAFSSQIAYASETRLDFKSELQERLARHGATVTYEVVNEEGPPHDRRFEVRASAGQEKPWAAVPADRRRKLNRLRPSRPSRKCADVSQISIPEGLQVLS